MQDKVKKEKEGSSFIGFLFWLMNIVHFSD